MKLPRDVSGQQLTNALVKKWDYKVMHQRGSHIILETGTPGSHRIAIPNHKSLRIGTLNSIIRAIAEHKQTSREQIVKTL